MYVHVDELSPSKAILTSWRQRHVDVLVDELATALMTSLRISSFRPSEALTRTTTTTPMMTLMGTINEDCEDDNEEEEDDNDKY